MAYKISEVSRILNIPIDTIRYYQKQGIIAPRRNEENGYHEFDAEDMDTLLYYKKHRGLDFSAREITDILTSDSSDAYLSRCVAKQEEIEKKLSWYTLLRQKNRNYIDVLAAIPDRLGRFELTMQPEAYYFINSNNDVFRTQGAVRDVFKSWMACYPFVENYYTIAPGELEGSQASFHYRRGFTIKKMWADRLPVLINDEVRFIPERRAVYTVVRTANNRVFTPDLFADALAFIDGEGLRLCDDIQGNVLTCVHEGGQVVRYMEVWLPVLAR